MRRFFRENRIAFALSLLCLIPGLLWVFFSDKWIFTESYGAETEHFLEADKIKDAFFVIGMSAVLFVTVYISRRKLQKTHLQYQHLFYVHPNPMWIYNIATLRFIAVNQAAIRQYGYSKQEFLSMTLADIRPPAEVPLLKQHISERKLGEKANSIWTHRKKSGELISVEVVADDVSFFDQPCRLVCATDITEKLRKDEDIERLSMVARNATNSIIITGEDAKIQWVNEAFTTLTGYTLPEVAGKRPSDFLHGPQTDQAVRDEIFTCMQQQKPFSGEILNYRKDGSVFWLRLTVSPVIANGRITNFVTVQTDITAIKEQNARLKDIAQTVSHGFRKPLANILGLLEFVDAHHTDQQVIDNLKISAEELDKEVRKIVEKTTWINWREW